MNAAIEGLTPEISGHEVVRWIDLLAGMPGMETKMSTRWQIAAKLGDGRCGCIYVHCDGYPEHALAVLNAHYAEQQRIDKLIALGDCLSVSPEHEKCDTFLSSGDEWEDVQPTYGDDLHAVAEKHKHGDEQYRYTWDGSRWEMSRL